MSLEITYLTASITNPNIAGRAISSETRSISASSAQSGATPANAVFVRIVARADARFAYGSNPTASATSEFLGNGQQIERDAVPGWLIAGITA